MTNVANLSYLKTVTDNTPDLMRLFIKSFLDTAPPCMKNLRDALQTQNWTALKKAAHTYKPQVNYMGLTDIIPLVQDVEDCAAEQTNLDTLPDKLKRIEEVSLVALIELKEALAQLNS